MADRITEGKVKAALSSAAPEQQGEALLALIRAMAGGRDQTLYFGTVVARCLSSGGAAHTHIPRLAYAFICRCDHCVDFREWDSVREAIERDVHHGDADLATAALDTIGHLPLRVLQPAAAALAQSLTAILDSSSRCEHVRCSAASAAQHLLLRVGRVQTASDSTEISINKALHNLALALAACSLDASVLVSSEAMDSLAAICPSAPASSRLVGVQCLGDVLRLPDTSISILTSPHGDDVWSGSVAGKGVKTRGPSATAPEGNGGSLRMVASSVWESGVLGVVDSIAASVVGWLQEHYTLLIVRFLTLHERGRRKGLRLLVLVAASNLSPANQCGTLDTDADRNMQARGIRREDMVYLVGEEVLTPMALSPDLSFVTNACQGLLQLAQLLQVLDLECVFVCVCACVCAGLCVCVYVLSSSALRRHHSRAIREREQTACADGRQS